MKILLLVCTIMILFEVGAGQPSLAQPDESLVPLSDMQGNYGQESAGLYGSAGNTIPQFYRPMVQYAASAIQPLDSAGNPSPDGKIGFLSIGMSNTTQEFSAFMRLVNQHEALNPALVLVDGAQGGMDSVAWNQTETPWAVVRDRLAEAGIAPQQVQVIWLKTEVHSLTQYASDYDSQKRFRMMQIEQLIERLQAIFPNVRMVYATSRAYGGFYNAEVANNTSIPEPLSYEHGFAVRQVILDKIRQDQALLNEQAAYEALLPVVLWGPYLWAGETPRADGLFYTREDYARDGIHPSPQGQQKIANVMLTFFLTDPTARLWFRD